MTWRLGFEVSRAGHTHLRAADAAPILELYVTEFARWRRLGNRLCERSQETHTNSYEYRCRAEREREPYQIRHSFRLVPYAHGGAGAEIRRARRVGEFYAGSTRTASTEPSTLAHTIRPGSAVFKAS